MCTRRSFIFTTTLGGFGLALGGLDIALGTDRVTSDLSSSVGERIATSDSYLYRPYRSKLSTGPIATTWVQVDLGATQAFTAIKLFPLSTAFGAPGDGFPVRFRIECSDDVEFKSSHAIANFSDDDYPDPTDKIIKFVAQRAKGRYVRLTTTQFRAKKVPPYLQFVPEQARQEYLLSIRSTYLLSLSRIEVLSGDTNLAMGRPVQVDPVYGNAGDAQQLTRFPRPNGETIVTDNPQNVTSPEHWNPVRSRAKVPVAAIELADGPFSRAMRDNVRYLMESFSVDELLRPFRQRAGKPLQQEARAPHPFWDDALPGSNAGRFLMGAGKTLQWIDCVELRARMNAIIDGIAECARSDGYIMAYPESTLFISERGAYTRAWVTHGLIEAGYAGSNAAFKLLRAYYDWYNRMPYLSLVLRGCGFGPQGTVANTRTYFTPVGRPEDIRVVQRYLQENYWLDDLAARRLEAIWQYPYDRPHAYLVTFLESYLDLYRATGDRRYLDAVRGGWEMFRENWQYIGGSISLIEMQDCPPRSNPIHDRRGETCGSAFWILLNQRLHLLDPTEEDYILEIEKSIYNVLLANQSGSDGFRLHTRLVGNKEVATRINTCCEGQATRLVASLPEFIYSVDDDGIYVNLFESSNITWKKGAETLQLEMDTHFPSDGNVRLTIYATERTKAKIRIRIPSWAGGGIAITVNGSDAAVGLPGTYVTLDRTWVQSDLIVLNLSMAFKLTKYTGADQIEGRERYALEYGPLLMAAVGGDVEAEGKFTGNSPFDLVKLLRPKPGNPLHFTVPRLNLEWIPYYEVANQSFSCFPMLKAVQA